MAVTMSRRNHKDHEGYQRGVTLIEIVVAMGLLTLLMGLLWFLLGQFTGRGQLSVATGASRAIVQQQSRLAIRKLFHRLQEAIQILEPPVGKTAQHLIFRDVLNRTVRLQLDAANGQLVSERLVSGNYVGERELEQDNPMVKPIRVPFCESVHFTTLGPTAAFVTLTSADKHVADSFMSVIYLSNSRLTL